jgi:hypothetical protein
MVVDIDFCGISTVKNTSRERKVPTTPEDTNFAKIPQHRISKARIFVPYFE